MLGIVRLHDFNLAGWERSSDHSRPQPCRFKDHCGTTAGQLFVLQLQVVIRERRVCEGRPSLQPHTVAHDDSPA